MSPPGHFRSITLHKDAIKTILSTACLVGAADGLAAILLTYGLYGRPAIIVFQYIASGLLGAAAFSGGTFSGVIGLICHFFIAFVWTVIFWFLHPKVSLVLRSKVLKCIAYGCIIWGMMNLVVLPFSRIPASPFQFKSMMIGVCILIVAAGLPMVLSFDRYYFRR